MESRYTPHVVARINDLGDGEMKEVAAGDEKILLVRIDGRYHALGAHCTHYGAPLARGVLSEDRIVCPWHHACFNAADGDLLEPPALDALPCFDLKIEGEDVVVSLPDPLPDRRTPEMAAPDPETKEEIVILGGGAAGYAAAQTLREDGFAGHITMITREDRAPYDRPNLSKDYLHGHADPAWMPLRPDEFFAEHGIDLLFNKEIQRVDTAARTITFTDGSSRSYTTLLVASGGVPRRLKIDGADLENVFVLRSFDNADTIIAAAERAKRAVVIGASFIGMETAFSLCKRGLEVTVVAPEAVPFEKILGPEIGAMMLKVHESNGVAFKLGASVARLEGSEKVEAVVLGNGERIETDLVILGVGVQPATGFIEGLTLAQDGGIIVDEHLRAADGVYAAGDVAVFTDTLTGERTRIEHWRTALQQGRVAGHNMAGRSEPYDSIPFFWTMQFDVSLRYVGHATKWDEIIYQGDVGSHKFIAFYVRGGRVAAVAGMKHDQEMAALEELMRRDRMPSLEQLRSGSVNFVELLR